MSILKELKDFLFEFLKSAYIVVISLVVAIAGGGVVAFSTFGLMQNDFQPIYFFIGTSITLSGFTMIGGIFGKKNASKTEKDLFGLSIIFLFSAFSSILFIGLFSLIRGQEIDTWLNQVWFWLSAITNIIGICLFMVGFVSLLTILIILTMSHLINFI
jgi:phosphatidylserine synthase